MVQTQSAQPITRFEGEYEFLSNFYPCNVKDNIYNIVFPSAEHFYQSRKTNVLEEKHHILTLTAGQAKRYGKKITLRSNWNMFSTFEMSVAVNSKFEQNVELAERLSNTYPSHLEEGNMFHDRVWGKCYCDECRGLGSNMLGHILMYIRSEMKFRLKRLRFSLDSK